MNETPSNSRPPCFHRIGMSKYFEKIVGFWYVTKYQIIIHANKIQYRILIFDSNA
jgi:hypothetical protein